MKNQLLVERFQKLAGIQSLGEITPKVKEGMFSTSFDSEKRKIEDALDRWVKYSMKNGDSEGDVMSVGEKYLRDAVMVYIGGTISDEDLLDKYDDVMDK
jgi:hypothetical protein